MHLELENSNSDPGTRPIPAVLLNFLKVLCCIYTINWLFKTSKVEWSASTYGFAATWSDFGKAAVWRRFASSIPVRSDAKGSYWQGKRVERGSLPNWMNPRGFWPYGMPTGTFAACWTDFVPRISQLFHFYSGEPILITPEGRDEKREFSQL